MSFEAIQWAFEQAVPQSSAKLVLIALANFAGDDSTAWPSVAAICRLTTQDRKTVMRSLARLVSWGLVEDSGMRKGGTGSVVVYRLGSTKTGTPKQCQERDCLPDQAVPDFPASCTNFPDKQYQNSLEAVPKTVHGTSKEPIKEPVIEPKKARSRAPVVKIEVPDWMPADAWQDWCEFRRGRKWTERAQQLSIRTLTDLRSRGHPPKAVIEKSIENGWTGLFPLKDFHNGSHQPTPADRIRRNIAEAERREHDSIPGEFVLTAS